MRKKKKTEYEEVGIFRITEAEKNDCRKLSQLLLIKNISSYIRRAVKNQIEIDKQNLNIK